MLYELIGHGKKIYGLVDEIKSQEKKKRKLIVSRAEKRLIDECNKTILNLLDKIKEENSQIYFLLQSEPKIEVKKISEISVPVTAAFLKLTKKDLQKYLEELKITKEEVKKFIVSQKKKDVERLYQKTDYTVYQSSKFGKTANKFVEPLTVYLTTKYPDLFKPLIDSLKLVSINMLSKSYISIMLFGSIIAFFAIGILAGLYFFSIIKGFAIGLLGMIATLGVIYYYPKSNIEGRKKRIKNELPFAIVHMAAVAGSGTQPINMFTLLLESGEYKELSREIRKIMNYVNVFGYNLSTALKAAAATTPSPEFGELLNGIISAIETGGDLRAYLDGKAVDSLNGYKLERQKYVETIATYSDIYTSILIAAPLLFVTTLTIINVIGGEVGGLSVTTIATIGTFGVIPLLNVGFMMFLTLTQTEI